MGMLKAGFAYTAAGERRIFTVKSAFDREELCQEAFCVFYQQCRRGLFDGTRPIWPYLRQIVVNLAMGKARRSYREISTDQTDHLTAVTQTSDPVAQAEVGVLLADFRQGLSGEEQSVVALYFEQKHSQQAVGERLGLSRDQVYRKIRHIRAAALRYFRQKGWLDDP